MPCFALASTWRAAEVILQVGGSQDRSTCSYLDDGYGGQTEVEVPEVLVGQVQKCHRHHSEDTGMADEQGPTSAKSRRAGIAQDLVAIHRAGYRPLGQL